MDELKSRVDRLEREMAALRIVSWSQGVESGCDENHEPSPSESTHTIGRSESTHTIGRSESTHTIGRSLASIRSESFSTCTLGRGVDEANSVQDVSSDNLYSGSQASTPRANTIVEASEATTPHQEPSPSESTATSERSSASLFREFRGRGRDGEGYSTEPMSVENLSTLRRLYRENRNITPKDSGLRNTTSEAPAASDSSVPVQNGMSVNQSLQDQIQEKEDANPHTPRTVLRTLVAERIRWHLTENTTRPKLYRNGPNDKWRCSILSGRRNFFEDNIEFVYITDNELHQRYARGETIFETGNIPPSHPRWEELKPDFSVAEHWFCVVAWRYFGDSFWMDRFGSPIPNELLK